MKKPMLQRLCHHEILLSSVPAMTRKPPRNPVQRTQVALISQMLGGDSVLKAQCKSVIKQYLPQIIEILDTLPSDQARSPAVSMTFAHVGGVFARVARISSTAWRVYQRVPTSTPALEPRPMHHCHVPTAPATCECATICTEHLPFSPEALSVATQSVR